jgi:hypothetical protein
LRLNQVCVSVAYRRYRLLKIKIILKTTFIRLYLEGGINVQLRLEVGNNNELPTVGSA